MILSVKSNFELIEPIVRDTLYKTTSIETISKVDDQFYY